MRSVAGPRAVLTDLRVTRPFRDGYRKGGGAALAVVRPSTLVALWRVLQLCVAQGVIVIPQAANTGLTGGSTPWGDHYVSRAGSMPVVGGLMGSSRQSAASFRAVSLHELGLSGINLNITSS